MKRLFYDIETSPNIGLFWRSGRKISIDHNNIIKERQIICVSYKWQGKDKVHTIHWGKNQCDKKILRKFIPVLDKADEIIAHNGDAFDIKWIKGRAMKHRMPMQPQYKTVDTLKMARGKNGGSFNSNKLDYLAKFLNVPHKKADISFEVWKKILLDKCENSLKEMIEYCEQDIRTLEEVWNVLSQYTPHHTHEAVLQGENKWQCPTCTSVNVKKHDSAITASGTVRHVMRCKNCGRSYRVSGRSYSDYVEYRWGKDREAG